MKQSKTTLKELTHRYRAVLLKCALLNLAAFAVAMPAKAEDLVIDANSSKIISKTDTCSGGSCGGSYDKLNMTGGEFKIDRLNTDNDSVVFYFSDASTISGGKLILSTPSDSSDDVDGISLSFGNGLTVTGSDTVLDFSGTTMIDLYDRNTKLSVTDATIYGHDTPTTSLFDVRGDASFTNTNIKLENSSLITWDDAISQKGETKTQEEYNRLSETDKQKYAQDPHYYGSEGQYREKIQLPESFGGGYPSDEDTIKYDLFKEIYTDRPDQTLNFTKGTLSLKDSDVVGGKNIILDGTEVTMNHSLIGPLSENNVAGKKLSNNLTIKENARLTAENKSVLLAGNFWSEYNQIGEYLVEKGIKTNAEILASIKPIASKANINIEGNAQVNLNDSSAIVLLDKNEGQVNLSGGQLNMNDKSSVFGQVVINGGKLNVNGQNSVKTRADFIVTPASETNNAELVFINESGDYYGFSAIDGTAPAINLQSGAINLNGTLTADINATDGAIVFGKESVRLNGALSGANVDLAFKDNYVLSNLNNKATLKNITISAGKTLDIGENSLTASTIKDGTISAILTDAAKNTAIITANADKVTLKLDMSQASRDKVTQYKITNGTGFTFGDYATNRYAVSASEFDKANAKTLEKLSGWNGGDLWILRLATASEAAIEDLEKSGVVLPENEKNASKILDLASGILDKLPEHHKKVIEKVNDLLDKAQGKAEEIKQILREIAPDTSTSGSKTASNTAKSVINVINSRFGGGSPRRGRSGGDYTVGQTAVWAQGMMNYAKLDTDNGFDAHSNGFAAGFEANFTDSFKAGLGYAYTSTDISTERSKTDVKTHTGFVYGEYKPNKAYINGVVSFGRSDYDDTTRSLSLTSAYKTDTIAAQIAAGYKAGVLTPEAAVRFTNVKQKAYTDATGSEMSEKTADTWTGVLGAKIGKNYVLRANRKIGLSPELKVAATYDFARDDENRTVTLPDGSSYTATGEAMERFGVEAGAGVTVSIANSAEIALTYDGKFKKDYQDHTGMVNLKIKF